jgi:hypothetical protein
MIAYFIVNKLQVLALTLSNLKPIKILPLPRCQLRDEEGK